MAEAKPAPIFPHHARTTAALAHAWFGANNKTGAEPANTDRGYPDECRLQLSP
jgi:hypothetical protein